MLSDRDLIHRQMGDPAIVRLSRALGRLTSVVTCDEHRRPSGR